jgi:hypothetical protein
MANRFGESTFVVDEKTYTVRVDLKAWALAQDELTKGDRVPSVNLIGKRLDAGHLLTVMAVFWASLQRHHPAISMEHATELLHRSEGKGSEALVEAIKRSNPDVEDTAELGASTNPPEAQVKEDKPRGAGGRSTSKHAA